MAEKPAINLIELHELAASINLKLAIEYAQLGNEVRANAYRVAAHGERQFAAQAPLIMLDAAEGDECDD